MVYAHPSRHPKRHLDRLSRFCAAHGCNQQTHRKRYSVCSSMAHVCCAAAGLCAQTVRTADSERDDGDERLICGVVGGVALVLGEVVVRPQQERQLTRHDVAGHSTNRLQHCAACDNKRPDLTIHEPITKPNTCENYNVIQTFDEISLTRCKAKPARLSS